MKRVDRGETVSMSVRFTAGEMAVLRGAAARVGWTMTTFCRRAVLATAREVDAVPEVASPLGEIVARLTGG